MIGRLTGNLAECAPGSALIDVDGVGYSVQIPLSTYYGIASLRGRTVRLHVHTHVREDALVLYGFATTDEREAFENLTAISGVGPKMALAVLSGIDVEELRRAAVEADRAKLERIPGIGRKTAERILLDLRDRFDRTARSGRRAAGSAAAVPDAPFGGGIRGDAVSALVHLGYSREVASGAVDGAITDAGGQAVGPGLEAVLKAALRRLVR